MRQGQDKVIIRLPDGMRDQIQKAAKESCRTMNAEIVFHLRNALKPSPQTKTATE
ncbi:Arc family DNA-binding protein [Ochrobactrum sp. AP1BH01-1]|uniref:Arc family DNA-binding protein n=1 Tax=Ochrobactrum sp. AP1BH01-1 TaxID=2823874 RepID=UPI001B38F77C|nr:Arc family DNA-binding protein [Ochrobactrum sp. AP1BH01-1]MBQ0707868.1 Arc family DNA-binding protein [Ochrobactrum sp. AP1BH01-1]